MKIALFGYGKMGKMIEHLAEGRGHSIVAKVDVETTEIDYTNMDVAIDFSMPEAALKNIKGCIEAGVPIISGTTGWLDNYDDAVAFCKEHEGAFLYASNFSLGVHVFFELNRYLAQIMSALPEYKVSIDETHHTQKLDAPSGTAITLAEGIINASKYDTWSLNKNESGSVPIHSHRKGEVPGTHLVSYAGGIDEISIEHKAHNREGFALGAVIAAEWIHGKKGIFSMKDVLNLG
ncbi:MAG: 4-hydroxy-tetrahydrodipicolinate reductase [Eudoraea sp.]|nr:4-hydroxy-tetrahydrodipicolinate reductase [Eudoraea sp.]